MTVKRYKGYAIEIGAAATQVRLHGFHQVTFPGGNREDEAKAWVDAEAAKWAAAQGKGE